MKRITYTWLLAMALAGTFVPAAAAQDQPLGDYARKVRKEKEGDKPSAQVRKFDNDNLPKDDKLSVVGAAPEEPAAAADSSSASTPAGDQAAATPKPEDSKKADEDKQKANDDWKSKIGKQKDQIDLMSRELDVQQREYRLKAAAFYADAGDRLRNSGNWDKEDRQYKQQIADKQKTLDAAKQQLTDMQEQARKAGVPSKMRE